MPIAKVKTGKSPEGCLRYVLTKEQAEVLDSNIEGSTPTELARVFEEVIRFQKQPHKRPINRVVHHASIAFPVGMQLSDADTLAIAHRYLQSMGFTDNQYLIAAHHDTEHQHIHIIANRVRLDGTVVPDAWEQRRAEQVMREIEAEYHLPPVASSHEVTRKAPTVAQIRRARQTGETIPQTVIQDALDELAPQAMSLEALQHRLIQRGITMEVATRLEGNQGGTITLRYHYQDHSFTASQLGKRYTYTGLHRHLGLGQSTPVVPIDRKPSVDMERSLDLSTALNQLQRDNAEAGWFGETKAAMPNPELVAHHQQERYRYQARLQRLMRRIQSTRRNGATGLPTPDQVMQQCLMEALSPVETVKLVSQHPLVQRVYQEQGLTGVEGYLKQVVQEVKAMYVYKDKSELRASSCG
jgi:hypothetical protein